MFSILFRRLTYTAEKHTARIHDRNITIENMIPQLTEQEYLEQQRLIESRLFDVYIKYQDKQVKSDSYCRVGDV